MRRLLSGLHRLTPARVRRLVPAGIRRRLRRLGQGTTRRATSKPTTPATSRERAAREAMRSREWERAALLWEAVVEEQGASASARAFTQLGRARRLAHDLDGAVQAVEAGRLAHPDAVGLHIERAEIATAQRDWTDAAACWQAAIELAGERAPARAFVQLSRTHRAAGDWDAAGATIAAAARRFPDDLGVAAEDAAVSLRRYRTVTEAEKHVWKARLVEVEPVLVRAVRGGLRQGRVLVALGDVQLALRHLGDAEVTWRTVRDVWPSRADHAALKISSACRQRGELAAARRALDDVSPAGQQHAGYHAELRRVERREAWLAAAAIVPAARRQVEAGDASTLLAEVDRGLRLRGYAPEVVHRLAPLLDQLHAWATTPAPHATPGAAAPRAGPDPARPDPAGPDRASTVPLPHASKPHTSASTGRARVVSVSGFLYSGSGAVLDAVREQAGVDLPFGTREVGFLKKPDNLATITLPEARRVATLGGAVTAAVLASILGFGQTGRSLLELFLADDALADGALADGDAATGDRQVVGAGTELLLRLVGDLVAGLRASAEDARARGEEQVPREEVERHLRSFLDAVLCARDGGGRVALLNNAIIAHELDRLRLVTGAVGIAVVRDPRDQYVSQRLESPYALTCETFVATMTERYARFRDLQADPGLAGRIRVISFGDLVDDPACRLSLLDWLGLDDAPVDRLFVPSASRRNVGIHAEYAAQDEVATVHEALHEAYAALTQGH